MMPRMMVPDVLVPPLDVRPGDLPQIRCRCGSEFYKIVNVIKTPPVSSDPGKPTPPDALVDARMCINCGQVQDLCDHLQAILGPHHDQWRTRLCLRPGCAGMAYEVVYRVYRVSGLLMNTAADQSVGVRHCVCTTCKAELVLHGPNV